MNNLFARLSQKYPFLLQFSKFVIVGIINTGIDFAILNLLIFTTGKSSGIYYPIFKSISFTAAVINSYFMNKYWTFASHGNAKAGEFFKFLIVNLIGLGINVGAASYVVNVIGAPIGFSPVLWANIGAVSAVIITLFWNFFGMKVFVFKKEE
jgi:putative flippase GtrA